MTREQLHSDVIDHCNELLRLHPSERMGFMDTLAMLQEQFNEKLSLRLKNVNPGSSHSLFDHLGENFIKERPWMDDAMLRQEAQLCIILEIADEIGDECLEFLEKTLKQYRD